MELQDVHRPENGRATTVGSRTGGRGRPVRKALVAVTVVAAFLGALPGPALGQTQTNQRFRVVSAGPPGAQRTVIANGVITGVGTEVITSNPQGVATVTWTFPEGSLSVTINFTFDSTFDPRSCQRRLTLTGTWEITGGTGEFSGATGGGDFSGTNRIVLRHSSGGCVPPPRVLVQVFNFTGNVSLAGAAAA